MKSKNQPHGNTGNNHAKKPRDQRKTVTWRVMLTEEESAQFEAEMEAGEKKLSRSAFLRKKLGL